MQRVRKWAAPALAWRITATSIFMASRLRAVSRSVSPLAVEEPAVVKVSVSAERRFSASSKERRVRVDDSKNRLATVTPRSVGTRGMRRPSTSRMVRAVLRMCCNSSRVRPARPSR